MSTLALPTANNTASPLNPSLPNLPGSSSRRTPLSLPTPVPANGVPIIPLGMARSPSNEMKEIDLEEDDGDEDEDEGEAKKKKNRKKAAGSTETGKSEYKYSNEISQMMFVFGEVQDPLPETVRLVEDIVRGQIIEIVTRARLLSHLRSSRFLTAEDLIFLIRDDRGKVNRLRTYLSWKDVRKRAKEDEEGDVDVEDADKAGPKGRRTMVKLPWELLTPFGDFLKNLPSSQTRVDEDDDEDEDEMQAYQDSMQRLKDADEITKKMTKDEYVHYSDCRQASFTYRKARRFREFVNFSAYLDLRPNDDIVDILGFLSFEMVRSLCVTSLDVRDKHAQQVALPVSSSNRERERAKAPKGSSPVKRKLTLGAGESPTKKTKVEGGSPEPSTPGVKMEKAATGSLQNPSHAAPVSLFAPPPSARQPLLPAHVLEAFAQIQREQAAHRSAGMSNWRGGGFGRNRVALV